MPGPHRAWLAGLWTVAAVLWISAPAPAATVRLDLRTTGEQQLAQLVYRAAPGERNAPSIYDVQPRAGLPEPGAAYWLEGSLRRTTAGNGCALVTVPNWERVPERFIRCPIPAGTRPGGALVDLGDRNDRAQIVLASAHSSVVGGRGHDRILGEGGTLSGGPGNDFLLGPGKLSGGPGDDEVQGSGRLDGGRGRDRIEGSGRLIGGPGRDEMRGSSERDVVDARDGSIDFVSCGAGRDTAVFDGLDTYLLSRGEAYWNWKEPPPRECERLRRHGAARATPMFVWGDATDPGIGYDWGVDVGCPPDGPAVCAGDVTVSLGGRVIGRDVFRIKRDSADFGGYWHPTEAFLRRTDGARVWVRVRSHDRHGRLRVASGAFRFLVDWPSDGPY